MSLPRRDHDHWYGVYVGGNKTGTARIFARPTRAGEHGGFVFGVEIEIASSEAMREFRFYEHDSPHRLCFVELALSDGAKCTYARRFTFDADGIDVADVEDGEIVGRRRLEPSGETIESYLRQFPDPDTATDSQRARFASFDPDVEADAEVVVVTRFEHGSDGALVALETGETGESVFRSGGVLVRGTVGGMELRLEERDTAHANLVANSRSFPVVARPTMPFPTSLRLICSEGSSSLDDPLNDPRLDCLHLEDNQLHISLAREQGVAATDADKYIDPTWEIDFNHAAIRHASNELKRTEEKPTQIETIIAWVSRSLEATNANLELPASRVLASGSGTSRDHAVLAVALARALNIPARVVAGLVYEDSDGEARYHGHVWIEAAINERWLPFDPMANRVVEDLRYLRLGRYDDVDWPHGIAQIVFD